MAPVLNSVYFWVFCCGLGDGLGSVFGEPGEGAIEGLGFVVGLPGDGPVIGVGAVDGELGVG